MVAGAAVLVARMQSGIRPSRVATACAETSQPPGGNRLPKNDARCPCTVTWTAEPPFT